MEGAPGLELATIPEEIMGGLVVARTVMPHQCLNVPLRVLNQSDKSIKLKKGYTVASLEPVTVVPECPEDPCDFRAMAAEVSDAQSEEWRTKLLEGIEPEISDEVRRELNQILIDYSDCFSKSEFD